MPDSGLNSIFERMQRIEADMEKLELGVEAKLESVKGEQRKQEKQVNKLENRADLSDQRMSSMETTLAKIEDNTTYTRRQMTGILVGAVATGVIGGAIALIYGLIGSGVI